MNCGSCGLQLPVGAANCPNCGAVTPYYYANIGTTPNDATFVSTPNPVAEQTPPTPYAAPPYGAIPPTQYAASPYEAAPPAPAGSPPYGAAPQNPYSSSPYAPYAPYGGLPLTPTPPVPPPVKRSGNRIGMIVGVVVLVLILIGIGGGVFAFLQYSAARNAAAAQAQATATAQAQAQATASAIVASQNPYTHSGTLAFSDSLSDNSQGHKWDENSTNCVFTGGAYHDIAPDGNFSDYCLAESSSASSLGDFAIEAQMQIIKGYSGGLVFRVASTSPNNELYEFVVAQDGTYTLYLRTGNTGADLKTLRAGSNAAIHQGLNQTNLIAVVAQGSTIMVYVNHQQIVSVTDSTYGQGQIGFIAEPATSGQPTEVVVSNAKVWML